ncbi:MAG: glutamate 5-kinase [Proteobacteria bacterium]|nr:glutamate 5-kinase [Pseudomonadota bacterium]
MTDNKRNKAVSRTKMEQSRRWVIKIGSALLTSNGTGVNFSLIAQLAQQINELRKSGVEVLLVSSGAVAAGVARLGWTSRPDDMPGLQAAAAVGQSALVRAYETQFDVHGMTIAQVLLTHADLANAERRENASAALGALIDLRVIPVVNENDTVATEEIRFGDNDNLAALVADLVVADFLVILTDQNGLYDGDPREHIEAHLISEAVAGDSKLKSYAGSSSSFGRGGMVTKLEAAEHAARNGTSTVIAGGAVENVLLDIHQGRNVGTYLKAEKL